MTANQRLRLKKTTDWFAAGEGFLKAMRLLSDAAFKLFVFICLKADRHTAGFRGDTNQLASALRKSRNLIETSLAELGAKGVCLIECIDKADRQYLVHISDEFWPYCKPIDDSAGQCTNPYVLAVRQLFLELGCTNGRFGSCEEAQAKDLEKRGVPLEVAREAMIMAACRKYVSWLNNGYSEPISSIAYFESVIAEFLDSPPPADYREYLPFELKRLADHWSRGLLQQQKQTSGAREEKPRQQPVAKRRDDAAVLSRNPQVPVGTRKETR